MISYIKSKFLNVSLGIATLLVAAAFSATADTISVYLSSPGSTGTLYSGTTVETFSEYSTGIYTSSLTGPIGTYGLSSTTKLAVVADDQYGTGTGNYMAIGSQSGSSAPVTLTLTGNVSYFGFSWNAGDVNNQLSFYNGSILEGIYDTSSIFTVLKQSMTVAALNGNTYMSSSYYGKPGSTTMDSSEPFAYINFIDTGSFNKVVFGNSNTTSTGFESDNHTILTAPPTANGTFVPVGIAFVPEPGDFALFFGLATMGSLFGIRRRNRK